MLVGARTTVGKSALAMSFMERQIDRGWKVALANVSGDERRTGLAAPTVDALLCEHRKAPIWPPERGGLSSPCDCGKRATKVRTSDHRPSQTCTVGEPSSLMGCPAWWPRDAPFCYVDYVGLLRGSDNGAPRWEQMLEVSRCLKAIARELKIPVIALVQLNREAADMREPGLHNIRDTGALEQDRRCCPHPHPVRRGESAEDSIPASLFLKKQRSGPTGKIALMFRKSLTESREAGE